MRLRQSITSFKITPLGWMVLLLFPIAVAVFVLGPTSSQVPALVVAVLVLLFAIGGAFTGLQGMESVSNAGAEFRPRKGAGPIEEEVSDPEAWRKERERREQGERERASSSEPDQASWPAD